MRRVRSVPVVPCVLCVLLGALIAGCHSPQPARPATADDLAKVQQRTTAFFAAVDEGRTDAADALLDPGFSLFQNLRQFDRAMLLGRLRAREAAHAAPRSRTCSEVSLVRATSAIVYTADCVEQLPAEGEVPARVRDGWNTLVWARGPRGDWRLVHWGWKPGGIAAEREMWNDTFREDVGFKHTANQLLVDTVRDVAPGRALDLMTGQGRNALHLAAHGWKVTGVDISTTGIEAAAATARREKLELTLLVADADHHDLGVEVWDLVTMIYAGSDRALIEKAKRALAPGGLFVVEFFLKEGGPMGFDPGELASQFGGWAIEKDEIVEDVADWSLERTKLVRFVARKPGARGR